MLFDKRIQKHKKTQQTQKTKRSNKKANNNKNANKKLKKDLIKSSSVGELLVICIMIGGFHAKIKISI